MKCLINNFGSSMVEVSIVMVIGSIVLVGAYQTQRYVSQSAERESLKAVLQKDICTVAEFIEKDVRMAGLGLPGNGIKITQSDSANDELSIFVNEERRETRLFQTANPSDSFLCVENAIGARENGWVCIEDMSDTVYREISRIGYGTMGADTILFSLPLGKGPFKIHSKVYPANRIYYCANSLVNVEFKRQINGMDITLSTVIDSMKITPMNSVGLPVTDQSATTVLSVVFGGKVGKGNNTAFFSGSSEVNIRNVF